MGTREKQRRNIEQSPRQVRFEDLDALLRAYGFQARQPGRGGSHYFYYRDRHLLSVPKSHPHLKEYVVRRALSMIQEIEAKEGREDEENSG